LQLREAKCGFCRWPVEVLFEGQGNMYLHTGWDKFTSSHNLEVGFLLTFLHEGDNKLIIKVFDKTSCHRNYHSDESGEDIDN
jgi:hypothetical protein